MTNDPEARVRAILGDNLQTGAIRAVLALAAFAAIGALIGLIFR